MAKFNKLILLVFALQFACPYGYASAPMKQFTKAFAAGYRMLNIPDFNYDYREYLNSIPSVENLRKQEVFFSIQNEKINKINYEKLNLSDKIQYDHILYQIGFNLERISLEMKWVKEGRKLVAGGVTALNHKQEWYALFIKKFVSMDISPEEIMTYGLEEVRRIHDEMDSIIRKNNFSDLKSFYQHLGDSSFYYYQKSDIQKAFAKTDSAIRMNLPYFIGDVNLPEIAPMEWEGAGANTPPGMYLSTEDNAYGKDVFLYNFYGNRYPKRTIDWIYLHEAIPGHHLQSVLRKNQQENEISELFLYSGNFEGWACYVEYSGKKLGVYENDINYFGKCEWDLIRSIRLVLEVGIHSQGWTTEQALNYWKENVTGQDEIAMREITRVTNWPGQALSYKLGARFLFKKLWQMTRDYEGTFELQKFHNVYLSFGMCPLQVIDKHFSDAYKNFNINE